MVLNETKIAGLPPLPKHIDERGSMKDIDGHKRYFTIEDEIARQQETARHGKLIYIQKIRYEEDQRLEYRFTYFMIGVKEGAKGRWVFGQYSLFIPPQDLEWLLKEARARKWPGF